MNVLNGQIPEWPKGTDCKSAAICFGGSNPPLPILFLKRIIIIAGWSSLEARRAHNPKVASSNLAPATRRALLQRSENPVVVSFLFKNIVVVQRKDTYYNADREKELGSILMKEAILTAKIKHKKV